MSGARSKAAFTGALCGVAIIVTLMVLGLSMTAGQFVVWVCVLSALLGGISLWYAHQMVVRIAEDEPTPEHLKIKFDDAMMWLSTARLRQLLHELSTSQEGGDGQIRAATRRHWVELIYLLWRRVLVGCLLSALGVLVAVATSHTGSAVLFIAGVVLATVLWCLPRYLDWWSWAFILTNKRILLITQPPAWLWWRKREAPFLPLWDVNFSKVQDSRLSVFGNTFNYGNLVIDGLSRLDVEFNTLARMPRHHTIQSVVADMILQNRTTRR
jgi:hypothetical protein